ncbi:hypothetical protein B2J88_29140 [Rhodococcus sp. SRB_17]|nr:hypothetical protein [Rhodococcus sp. SRB_17]
MLTARELIDSSSISKLQIRVILLCGLAAMAEGYDIISISLAVLPITDDWGITGTESGLLFSAGLVGMAVGSIALGPVGDRYGRRPLLVASLLIITLGMALSAVAGDVTQLALLRLLTGLGMGGIIPSLPVIVGEYAPARKRPTLIALFAIGIPLGGLLGGAVAAVLMNHFSWRSAFWLGAVMTGVIALVAYLAIPESPDYLESRGTAAARKKLDELVRKMNLKPSTVVEAAGVVPKVAAGSGNAALKSWALVITCVVFFLVNSVYFFGNSWTPKLLTLAGMSQNEGISGGLLFSLGGVIGTLIFAALAIRFSAMWVTCGFALGGAVLFGFMSIISTQLNPVLVSTALLGVCLMATFTGLYVMVPILFRPEARVSAMGIAAGLGRVGSIATPMIVGAMVDLGWPTSSIFLTFVLPALLAALGIAYAQIRNSRTTGAATKELAAV